jgi:hypothetical protein
MMYYQATTIGRIPLPAFVQPYLFKSAYPVLDLADDRGLPKNDRTPVTNRLASIVADTASGSNSAPDGRYFMSCIATIDATAAPVTMTLEIHARLLLLLSVAKPTAADAMPRAMAMLPHAFCNVVNVPGSMAPGMNSMFDDK